MAEKYDKNGYGGGDFKRNMPQEHAKPDQDGDEISTALVDKAGEYMRELLGEKLKIDQQKFPISIKLIDQEVSRVQSLGRVPTKDLRYVDIYREKPIKVSVKVLVPVKEHPKFNFVGKLLGPKGNSMKRLQEETMCKMAVLGRGSMKDKQKEEELRQALDPKYAHLTDDLHVEITAIGPPAEAHARIAFALAEVRKFLIPDNNDVIRQEQIRELQDPMVPMPPPHHPRPHHPPMPPQEPPAPPRPIFRPTAPRSSGGRGASVNSSPRMAPKTKIMSILDRARAAMEETYGYEEGYERSPMSRDEEYYGGGYEEAPPPPHIEGYHHHAPPQHHHAPPPPHHYAPTPPHHHHREAPSGAPVADSYHYPPTRHHEHEYGGSTSSSHHRSYKTTSRPESHGSGIRRTPSSSRDTRYRSSPYTRPSK